MSENALMIIGGGHVEVAFLFHDFPNSCLNHQSYWGVIMVTTFVVHFQLEEL